MKQLIKESKMNSPATILLVDDDEEFLRRQQQALEQAGYAVITAHGRSEAEELAAAGTTFDCAVIDLMMEEADGGFVLAYHLKKERAALPIVMVTDVTSETGLHFGEVRESEKKWIKADTVLAKPIRFEQLNREITRLLAKPL
jgi:CheY-like chemotaxis protein